MIDKKLTKILSFQYTILAFILILLAGGLVLLPAKNKQKGIKPEKALSNAISPERYISTDELAHIIINQDPSFLLIDIRNEKDYKQYSLPNAVHIPIDKFLDEKNQDYLSQEAYTIVLFSNDYFLADQAWMLCNRLGYKNIRVLKGGINQWFNSIINPKKPSENMPLTAFKKYDFRKAASMYFGVAYPEQVKVVKQKKYSPKKIVTVKKKKKLPVEGGC